MHAFHPTIGIQRSYVRLDDLLDGDAIPAVRQRHEARQPTRDPYVGKVQTPAVFVSHHRREGQAEIGDVRERMTRRLRHGLRGQHREDLFVEIRPHCIPGGWVQILPL